jgi:hypothetical protein
VKRGFVVNRYFLTRFDVMQGNEQDMAVKNLHVGAGLTRVINVMSAISPAAAIKAPAIINGADAQLAPSGPSIGFSVGNLLALVLCYFPAASKVGH